MLEEYTHTDSSLHSAMAYTSVPIAVLSDGVDPHARLAHLMRHPLRSRRGEEASQSEAPRSNTNTNASPRRRGVLSDHRKSHSNPDNAGLFVSDSIASYHHCVPYRRGNVDTRPHGPHLFASTSAPATLALVRIHPFMSMDQSGDIITRSKPLYQQREEGNTYPTGIHPSSGVRGPIDDDDQRRTSSMLGLSVESIRSKSPRSVKASSRSDPDGFIKKTTPTSTPTTSSGSQSPPAIYQVESKTIQSPAPAPSLATHSTRRSSRRVEREPGERLPHLLNKIIRQTEAEDAEIFRRAYFAYRRT